MDELNATGIPTSRYAKVIEVDKIKEHIARLPKADKQTVSSELKKISVEVVKVDEIKEHIARLPKADKQTVSSGTHNLKKISVEVVEVGN
jgi:hypothetical protein